MVEASGNKETFDERLNMDATQLEFALQMRSRISIMPNM